ncbi:MAG TPA: ribosomal-protein-alanine N-acetyltransferase [Lachnospiraceae bacterium]|jgi:ribosomal-protein-alanine N-acetyltransferase|nr:ribosomal-protein-alanine N-acetyltransferase [Lachnospiraceae bacterium]
MSKIQILRLTPEDAAAAAGVEKACFSAPWSENVYHATLLLPYAHYFGAFDGELLIGTCGLQAPCGDGEISNVAVLPSYRRQGIAHDLLETTLRESEPYVTTGDCTLEVREGNIAARSLYESFGFVIEGRRRNYYTDPPEDALIMWRRGKREHL